MNKELSPIPNIAPAKNKHRILGGILATGLSLVGCTPGESATSTPSTKPNTIVTTIPGVTTIPNTELPSTTVVFTTTEAPTTTTEVPISRYEPTGEFLTNDNPTPLGTYEETYTYPEYGTVAQAMGIVDRTYTEVMEFDGKSYNMAFVDIVFGYDANDQPIKAKVLVGTMSDPVNPDLDIVPAGVVDGMDPHSDGAITRYTWHSVQELMDPTNKETGLFRGRQVGFEFNTFLNPELVSKERANLPNNPDIVTFFEVELDGTAYNEQLDQKLHGKPVELGLNVPIAFAQGQFVFAPPL